MPQFDHASHLNIYGGNFNNIEGDPSTIKRMKEILEDDERQKVMAWVSPEDVSAKHFDVANRREPGTGEWMLNSATFQAWEHGVGQALWCSGMPGGGKTVLASLIIDHLLALQLREAVGTTAVAWVYFNYKDELKQTPDAIHLSLIRQLAGFSIELYALLRSARRKDPNSRPSARKLMTDLRILAREFNQVFIVVDALDECATDSRDAVLDILSDLQGSGADILITSRDNVKESIDDSGLVGVQRIDIRASTDDITKYVNARLQKRLARIIRTKPSLQDEIVKAIVGLCEGMFLMATFHIESLRKTHNAGEVFEALKVLPKTFPGIYNDAMNRIESDSDHSKLALRVLSFLIYARRQLTLPELQHFLAVRPGDTDFCDEYITEKDILISICAGLVVVDDETGIIRLVHLTAQEYFDNNRAVRFPLGDQEMGHICLTYLSFNTFRDMSDLLGLLRRYVLLAYIVQYWHVHVSNHQDTLNSLLRVFLKDDALLRSYFHFMEQFRQRDFIRLISPPRYDGHTGLHAAADGGLLLAASWLIADGTSVNSQDGTGSTALIYSSRRGYAKVADLLITNGADVNTAGSYGTALLVASEGGHETVVRLLLEHDADVNAWSGLGSTALLTSSEGGHEPVDRLLLEHGAEVNAQNRLGSTVLLTASVMRLLREHGTDVNARSRLGSTALLMASEGGHEPGVRLLLEHSVDAGNRVGSTALMAASECGHEPVVRLLLEHGADVNASNRVGSTALMAASEGGHEPVVRLLLEHGADVPAQGGVFGTAMLAASSCGHETVVRLLLEHGADVNARNRVGSTALLMASEGGHEPVVRLLLELGADIDAWNRVGSTALMAASEGGHAPVVRLLLVHDADVNAQGEWYGTALMAASDHGHGEVVRLLLEHGADVHAQGGVFGTAMLAASSCGQERVVSLLLEHGADVDAQGEYGTALVMASLRGHEPVVRLLLEHGADVDAGGRLQGTALQAVSKGRHEAVVQLLREYAAVDVGV